MIKRYIDRKISRLMAKLYDEEHGGELVETALLLGFMVITALALMSRVGVKVFNYWIDIRDLM